MSGVVEEATCEGDVAGSNPTGRVRFYTKKCATCDFSTEKHRNRFRTICAILREKVSDL